MKDMRLKDFPTFIRTVDVNDTMLNFAVQETSRASQAFTIILNTFEDLEQSAITTLEKILPPIYSIGPLTLLSRNKISNESPITNITTSLWKKEDFCLELLDGHQDPCSLVYVNFGSITVMDNEQLLKFAWGLANCGYHFLWVIRPDLIKGESSVLPPEFIEETKEMIDDQLQVCMREWGVGLEIDNNVKGKEVEELIREMMAGEQKGKEIRKKAMEWKESAVKATSTDGASLVNFEKMINEILLGNKEDQQKKNGVKCVNI
ncbi:hypothetical protein M5K25_023606 [Dendrobium thyrsiflorum]|uniref:Uncharacterized protein n=1 Tax=Dendrobium thyrsiflorum TaxID=117978 RepID=A0ABD0UFL2_DENTH